MLQLSKVGTLLRDSWWPVARAVKVWHGPKLREYHWREGDGKSRKLFLQMRRLFAWEPDVNYYETDLEWNCTCNRKEVMLVTLSVSHVAFYTMPILPSALHFVADFTETLDPSFTICLLCERKCHASIKNYASISLSCYVSISRSKFPPPNP